MLPLPSQHKTSHLSTKRWMFISQAKVLMFACISHIFPLGLFVCLNQSEAFRLSSRRSQDKAERQGDRLGSDPHFQTKHSAKKPSRVVSLHAMNYVLLHITMLQYINSVTHCLYDVALFAEKKYFCIHIFLLYHKSTVLYIRTLETLCQAIKSSFHCDMN